MVKLFLHVSVCVTEWHHFFFLAFTVPFACCTTVKDLSFVLGTLCDNPTKPCIKLSLLFPCLSISLLLCDSCLVISSPANLWALP